MPAVVSPLLAASPGSMTDFGACLCRSARAAHGEFLLSDLLTAQGQTLTLPLADKHGRQLPGCVAVLSAEELPNSNAVVSWSLGREGRRGLAGAALRGSPLDSCFNRPPHARLHPPNLATPRPSLQVQLTLGASKLENKDTWGKSDPFVRISKARENGEWAPVLKTEVSGRGGGEGGRGRRGAPRHLLLCACLAARLR